MSERLVANKNLGAAKKAKQDEHYTQWADIEREMNAYLEFNTDAFRGKIVLLPCDDPEWSNFTKFFALHFSDFGLKKLISTSYAPESNAAGTFYAPSLFETKSPVYNEELSKVRGRVFTLIANDLTGDGVINIDDLHWEYLEGDGDFRSPEVTALREEADFVITNPPFSLFREYVAWLAGTGKKFSMIGSMNATTYKEVFMLIRKNKMWKGATANSTDMVFRVPESVEIAESDRLKAEKMGYKGHYTRLGNACWFTNIEHGRRHEPLELMTMDGNTKFSQHKEIRGVGYQHYYNYDALEVPFVDAIPSDYSGIMGVPISFLDKYDPDQFEIIANSDDMDMMAELGVKQLGKEFTRIYFEQGGTGAISPGRRMLGLTEPRYRTAFKRILIRKKA